MSKTLSLLPKTHKLMNVPDAKKIFIVDYLESVGIKPSKVYPGAVWYKSPFRKESEPSFKVSLSKNVWFDFGIGEGGTVLDLIKKIDNCDTHDALEKIIQSSFSFDPKRFKSKEQEGKLEVLEVRPLMSDALIQYIESRRISLKFATKYLKECTYTVYGRKYFALAFQNDKGGFEIRSRKFKGSSSPKFITTVKGKSDTFNIFEGFFDFLSCCTYYNQIPSNTSIILNSVTFMRKIVPFLKDKNCHLFLDNDKSGISAANVISESGIQNTNYSTILYPDFKDFNEFLMQSNHIINSPKTEKS